MEHVRPLTAQIAFDNVRNVVRDVAMPAKDHEYMSECFVFLAQRLNVAAQADAAAEKAKNASSQTALTPIPAGASALSTNPSAGSAEEGSAANANGSKSELPTGEASPTQASPAS